METIMSHLSPSSFSSRREFLIRSAASFAAGSLVAGMSRNALAAVHPNLSARETTLGFLSLLGNDQAAAARLPYADARRSQWHFIPMESRKGLPLREMNSEQRQAAMGVMATLLSQEGFQRAANIMAYEAILLELEGPAQAKRRDYLKFYFAIYGNPDPRELWGVSIEGHHLSINLTFQGDRIVDSTPQFFGVNPASLRRDFQTPDPLGSDAKIRFEKGKRLLLPEESASFDLLSSLDAAQQHRAVFSDTCPDDIQWPGQPQPVPSAPTGLPFAEMTEAQQKKGSAIIDAYFSTMPAAVAQDRWSLLRREGFDRISFGWAGGTAPDQQHFIRLQGPGFIAELCNFQTDPEGNVANHIHSVWRDLTGDFHLPIAS
jgi:hypothetical protein